MPDYNHTAAMAELRAKNSLKISKSTTAPKGWSAYMTCDGSCPKNPGPMGIGYSISFNSEEDKEGIDVGLRLGDGTNNRAEYLSLILGLRRAILEGITDIHIEMDSQLIVRQVMGEWAVKKGLLKPLREEATGLLAMFRSWSLKYIPRESNDTADYLSKHPDDFADPTPSDPAVIIMGKHNPHPAKFSRRQAAMMQWWWATGRCRTETRLSRIFGCTPGNCGQIARGEKYADVTAKDLEWSEP